ncbi:Uncharacterized protein APZ42_018333 [Daphnia magna]|uniref:Uncharacterized protein n=1 Tax=Daphnia magna TaxID=35525 RepID=A0A164Z4K6_9CRUS|nr:Uncharacterized protein APZ42_018333 [Daphnia magna]
MNRRFYFSFFLNFSFSWGLVVSQHRCVCVCVYLYIKQVIIHLKYSLDFFLITNRR